MYNWRKYEIFPWWYNHFRWQKSIQIVKWMGFSQNFGIQNWSNHLVAALLYKYVGFFDSYCNGLFFNFQWEQTAVVKRLQQNCFHHPTRPIVMSERSLQVLEKIGLLKVCKTFQPYKKTQPWFFRPWLL